MLSLTKGQNFIDIDGRSLLEKFHKSMFKLLSAVYPTYDWLPWKFDTVPRNFWNDITNQRKFMNWVANELEVNKMEDWYGVSNKVNIGVSFVLTIKKLIDLGGCTILNQNDGSLFKLLSVIYPETEWLPWKFDNAPRNYWNDITNQKRFMNWAAKELEIKNMEDWYSVSNQVYAY